MSAIISRKGVKVTSRVALLLGLMFVAAGCAAPNCYLWEVKSPTTSVYLLGSIHIAKPDIYPLDPAVEAVYRSADAIAVEVDLNKATEQQAAILMLQRGTYMDGRTLEDDLAPETLALLRRFLARKGMDWDAVRNIKPWLLGQMLVLQTAQALGYRADLGLDKHFADRSRGRKPILELETIESQLELLAGLDPQAQDLLLRETLNSLPELDKQLSSVMDAWKRGDTKAVDTLIREGWPEQKAVEKWRQALLTDRNAQMAKRIAPWLDDHKKILVIVGSAHLAGEGNILSILAEGGHTIRQVPKVRKGASHALTEQPETTHDR